MSEVIELNSRRDLSESADIWVRTFKNDVDAAVDTLVRAGEALVAEPIIDTLMSGYGAGSDAGPAIVWLGAREYIGGLVRAAIEKAKRDG